MLMRVIRSLENGEENLNEPQTKAREGRAVHLLVVTLVILHLFVF